MSLAANYFQVELAGGSAGAVNKYSVEFEPALPDDDRTLRKSILANCSTAIKEHLSFYINWGTCLYSLQRSPDSLILEREHDGNPFKIRIEWLQVIDRRDRDYLNFLKIVFNSMMRALRFETIGQKAFNVANEQSLEAHGIKVWPGFDARIIMREGGPLLNVDVCFKVIRKDTVLR